MLVLTIFIPYLKIVSSCINYISKITIFSFEVKIVILIKKSIPLHTKFVLLLKLEFSPKNRNNYFYHFHEVHKCY